MGAPGDRNAQRLQSDRRMRPLKISAGLVSLGVLVALFVTSLNRAPNPAFSVLVAVAIVLLAGAMAWGVRRSRGGDRHR